MAAARKLEQGSRRVTRVIKHRGRPDEKVRRLIHPVSSIPIPLTDTRKAIVFLSNRIHASDKSNKEIAELADVCTSTIGRLHTRDVVEPRLTTLIKVASVFGHGFEIT